MTNKIINKEIEADESGLEKEDSESENEIKISNPFNPNKVQFEQKAMTIDSLLKRVQYNEINLSPEFQRRPDLWNNKKKSQFIESILLRIPLPVFYFNGKDDGNWEVIDGLQRISTLKTFILDKGFKLEQMEYLTGGSKNCHSERSEESKFLLNSIR